MIYEQETIRTLYRRLLTLYPRGFRERLGESMEQTFNDLCTEKRQTRQGLFGFVLSAFVGTIAGIVQEYVLLFAEGDTMKNTFTSLGAPALIGLLFVIPFMVMEAVNTRNINAVFNIPLFGIMWLLPVLFILIGMPIVRNVRAGNSLLANPVLLLIRVVFLILIAWFWAGLLIDQMPCFLGIPNCD